MLAFGLNSFFFSRLLSLTFLFNTANTLYSLSHLRYSLVILDVLPITLHGVSHHKYSLYHYVTNAKYILSSSIIQDQGDISLGSEIIATSLGVA